jgi:hypothetical protein
MLTSCRLRQTERVEVPLRRRPNINYLGEETVSLLF